MNFETVFDWLNQNYGKGSAYEQKLADGVLSLIEEVQALRAEVGKLKAETVKEG